MLQNHQKKNFYEDFLSLLGILSKNFRFPNIPRKMPSEVASRAVFFLKYNHFDSDNPIVALKSGRN